MGKEPADKYTLKEHKERLQGPMKWNKSNYTKSMDKYIQSCSEQKSYQWTTQRSLGPATFDTFNPHRNPDQTAASPIAFANDHEVCHWRQTAAISGRPSTINCQSTSAQCNLPVRGSAFISIMVCISSTLCIPSCADC